MSHRFEHGASQEQGNAEDAQDIKCAQVDGGGDTADRPWWKHFGPGLITGAADDDPSGIGTYSVAGAQYGYSLLWLIPFCIPLMIVVQEMCGRVGVITGRGIAWVVREHYPRWLLVGCVALLIGANVINIYADLNVMAASANMLFHGQFWLWLILLTSFIVLSQVFIPYRYYVKLLKWLCLALGAYVVVALMPSVHNNWALIVKRMFVPSWSWKPAFIMTIVGVLGTTISPYLFFWQAGEEVEESIAEGRADAPGHLLKRATDQDMKSLRSDTAVGMVASQLISFFIVICTAATLNAHGKTDINTAQDAAAALRPLGPAAYWLFTLGILGTGLLAIPTLAGSVAYAVSESFGWRYGLFRRFKRAKAFYVTLAATIILGCILNFVHSLNPVKALFYSAVLNGVIAVPLLIVLMFICNNRNIVKDRVNSPVYNILGWLTVVLMGAVVGCMFWAMKTGNTG